MALPSTFPVDEGHPLPTGIVLAVAPGNPTFGCELQRTSDLGGGTPASSAATSIEQIARFPTMGFQYLDALPVDDALRFYRARHTADGYDAGAWTAWTTGSAPVQLTHDFIALSMQGLSAPVGGYFLRAQNSAGSQASTSIWMPATETFKVGTTGTASSLSKTIVQPYSAFIPLDSSQQYAISTGASWAPSSSAPGIAAIFPVTSATLNGIVPMQFPPGITITKVRMLSFLSTTSSGNVVTGSFTRVSSTDPTSLSALATLTQTTTGWVVTNSSVMAELVGSTNLYEWRFGMTPTSSNGIFGGNDNAGLAQVQADYTMPSYDKAY